MDRNVYRDWVKSEDLVRTVVSCLETDICIMGDRDLKAEALDSICKYRKEIEDYIKIDLAFRDSLEPIEAESSPSPIIKSMIAAGKAANVGPFAAVAGAVAEHVGRDLLAYSKEIIVENGGDIFIKSQRDRRFGIFAGESPLTGALGFEIMAQDTPLGVCTSSGTIGHSLSFGKADAVCIISKDTATADATATAACNMVQSGDDIEKSISFAKSVKGVISVIVIVKDKFGTWGNIKLGV